jgi:hypothetical protein
MTSFGFPPPSPDPERSPSSPENQPGFDTARLPSRPAEEVAGDATAPKPRIGFIFSTDNPLAAVLIQLRQTQVPDPRLRTLEVKAAQWELENGSLTSDARRVFHLMAQASPEDEDNK